MIQMSEHNPLVKCAQQMSTRVPASDAIESCPRSWLYVRSVQEWVENNICTARRQTRYFFTANFIDRNAASFRFGAFVATALGHKPLQVGGGCGAAFDGQK